VLLRYPHYEFLCRLAELPEGAFYTPYNQLNVAMQRHLVNNGLALFFSANQDWQITARGRRAVAHLAEAFSKRLVKGHPILRRCAICFAEFDDKYHKKNGRRCSSCTLEIRKNEYHGIKHKIKAGVCDKCHERPRAKATASGKTYSYFCSECLGEQTLI
jgi:hypothetical protein